MTEQEWLASTNPAAMLRLLQMPIRQSIASDRKMRLFACACALASATRIAGTAYEQMLVDGQAPSGNFEYGHDPKRLAEIWCDHDGLEALMLSHHRPSRHPTKAVRADLLRHIIGNPWRQTTSLRVGDKVKAKPGNPLACGSGIYDHAIVVSLDPFALVSEQGDMLWTATKTPSDVLLVGHCEMTKAALDRWQREKQSYPPNGKVLQIPTEWPLTVLDLAGQLYAGRDVGPILHDALIDAGAPEELVRHFANAWPCQQCGGTGWREDVAGEDLDGRGGRLVQVRCEHDDSFVPMVQEYNDVGTSYWFNLLEPNTRHLTPERAQPKHPKGCWAIDAIINKE